MVDSFDPIVLRSGPVVLRSGPTVLIVPIRSFFVPVRWFFAPVRSFFVPVRRAAIDAGGLTPKIRPFFALGAAVACLVAHASRRPCGIRRAFLRAALEARTHNMEVNGNG
jgi:hypothetical protein